MPFDWETVARMHSALAWVVVALAALLWLVLRVVDAPPAPRGRTRELLVVLLAQGAVGYAQYVTELPVVLVGVPTPEMQLEVPLLDVFGRGGSLKSSWYGDCLPERDFPMLIDLYLQGRLPLDAFVTEEVGINDVDASFDTMKSMTTGRSFVSSASLIAGSISSGFVTRIARQP